MGTMEQPPGRVVGQRPQIGRRQKIILGTLLIVYAAFVGWAVNRGQWSGIIVFVLAVVWSTIRAVRRPTVVDNTGVRRHWRLRSSIQWRDVDRVAVQQPGIERVRLWMKDGKTITLDDVPIEESAAVAAIGGIPLAYPDKTPPPPRHVQRTDRDVAEEVTRRARALHDRGKTLDAEYQRLRGTTPDSPPPPSPPRSPIG